MRTTALTFFLLTMALCTVNSQSKNINETIFSIVDEITGKHKDIYIDLHKNPELSLMEFETAAKMAENLKRLGFSVTTNVGGTGVVGVLHNGEGRTIMLRTDMDALPIKEMTGLTYASEATAVDNSGNVVPVMHACGHDMHMTMWLATLQTMVTLKDKWQGTIMAVAQPAEEIGVGARNMIDDGLFKRFPVPDYALAYHVNSHTPAGRILYSPGPSYAGSVSAGMTVFGSGGHGAMPHNAIDPVVLSAKIIMEMQTIVSRTIDPLKPAVITVGAINGGSRHNIIPDQVEMKMTIRYFEDEVFELIKQSIERISEGAAIAAGLPRDKMPRVEFAEDSTPPVQNDPQLVLEVAGSMKEILGYEDVLQIGPRTAAEDFGRYGRTEENIPVAILLVGSASHDQYRDHKENGAFLPPVHHPEFMPDFYPTFRNGVAGMSRAMLDLFLGQ